MGASVEGSARRRDNIIIRFAEQTREVLASVLVDNKTEVNISPKISISAQPLKMALHRNPAMHGSRMVIFLHDSKKALF